MHSYKNKKLADLQIKFPVLQHPRLQENTYGLWVAFSRAGAGTHSHPRHWCVQLTVWFSYSGSWKPQHQHWVLQLATTSSAHTRCTRCQVLHPQFGQRVVSTGTVGVYWWYIITDPSTVICQWLMQWFDLPPCVNKLVCDLMVWLFCSIWPQILW